MNRIGTLAMGLVVLLGLGLGMSETFAKKGGNGGGKPGGGGSEPPADPAIAVAKDGSLVVMNEDGSNVTVVVTADDMGFDAIKDPTWSPDGSQLAFTAGDVGDYRAIKLINVDGTGLTDLRTRNDSGIFLRWSPTTLPDGVARLAYNDRELLGDGSLGNEYLFLMDADGSNPINTGKGGSSLSWSPDATQIALTRRENGLRVFAFGTDANGDLIITESPRYDLDADVTRVAWTKTQGDILAVTVNVSGGFEIWQIDLRDAVSTSDPEVYSLTTHTVLVSTPSINFDWSSDDGAIAFESGQSKPSGGLRNYGTWILGVSPYAAPELLYKGGSSPAWRR